MKLLFPKQNQNVLSPSSYTYISMRDLYISRIGLPILFCCREISGPILGIYESLTDTYMWKLGLRPRNSQKRDTSMGFSLQCTDVKTGECAVGEEGVVIRVCGESIDTPLRAALASIESSFLCQFQPLWSVFSGCRETEGG